MQTILTQCPRCQTSFKVSDKQLAIAAGMVRCGSCLDVFFAPDNRITIKQPASAVSPSESFSDDDRENDENEQGDPRHATPDASLSHIEDTTQYHPPTSLPAESGAFQFTHEAHATRDAASSADSGLTNSTSESSPNLEEELEFILDYEDDIELGDMMLDDAAHAELMADVFDVAIHDAGPDKVNADVKNSSETVREKESGDSDLHGIEYIHENAYEVINAFSEPGFHSAEPHAVAGTPELDATSLQDIGSAFSGLAESPQNSEASANIDEASEKIIAVAALAPGLELAEQALPIPADSRRTDYDDKDDPSHQQLSAYNHVAGEPPSYGFDIIPAGETTPDITARSPLDESQGLAETKNTEAETTTAEPDEIFADGFSADGDNHEIFQPDDSFSADDIPESAELHAPAFSALSSDELEEIEPTTAASPKIHSQRDKEELRRYLTELEDADALEALPTTTLDSIEADPLTFEVGQVFRKYVTTFGWFMLSVGLLAALVLQVVASNLEFMQTSPTYSRYLPVFCKVLACPEPERATAIQSLNSQDLLVRSHPDIPNALQVSFIFRNDAELPQPFPLVELTFMDSGKRLMANRLFKPEEYLPPELAVLDEMPASSSVQVMLEMVDPGSDAVNYAIGFRDPATELPSNSSPSVAVP